MTTLVLRCYQGGLASAPDPRALRATLERLTIAPDASGAAGVYAGDGGEGTIDLSRPTEVHLTVTTSSHGLVDLVYDLATSTGMTIAPDPGHGIYLTDGDQSVELPEALAGRAHTCVDGAELHWWLGREAALRSGPTTPTPLSPERPARPAAVTRGDALRSLFGLRRD